LNQLFQRRVTASLDLTDAEFDRKLAQCRHHLKSYTAASEPRARPVSALELGTGWYPIVPIGLALAGVERVITIDISPLLSAERVRRVFERYAAVLASGPEALGFEIVPDRAVAVTEAARDRAAGSVQELLERIGVTALVADARDTGLPDGSLDLIVSNNTFEHIPPPMLGEIVVAFSGLAAPGAVMDHFVDLSDHYAHFDPSITEFNYLRFSDRAWRPFNNPLHYQSRLRASDYRRIVEDAGFTVIATEPLPGAVEQLRAITPAPRFRGYAEDDLLVLRTWLTAVAPAHGSRTAAGGQGAAGAQA
jgi:hypothetical protein